MKFSNNINRSKLTFRPLRWKCGLTKEGREKGFVYWDVFAPDWNGKRERKFAIVKKSPHETEFAVYMYSNDSNDHNESYKTIQEADSAIEKEYNRHMNIVCFGRSADRK